MLIKALNFNIQWRSPSENFKLIEKFLEQQSADLFLLPEMFSTGFCMDSKTIADDSEKTLEWMKSLAKHKNSAIAGSVSIKENEIFYNRFYFVTPTNEVYHYDKKHLFSYGGEHLSYSPGKERVIVNYMGFRILLLICYDLRFPVFSRNQGDYDAILYVANWPNSRIDTWKTLLKARAIENQSYVFGVNRIGTDGNKLYYPESSLCFFADGTEISSTTQNIISAEWCLEKLFAFREEFSFLSDRDSFTIN